MDLWGIADYTPFAERLAPAAQALVDETAPLADRRVLDLGAGTGNVAVLARAAGAEVTACDPSPRMVRLGQERTDADVRWLEADAENVPLPDGSIDAVLSAFGLIFAPNPKDAVEEVRRVLAPGGILAFTAWSTDSFMAGMNRTLMQFAPPPPDAPRPITWGDRDTLLERLGNGFEAVQAQAWTLPWQFESGPAMTQFLLAHSPPHLAAAKAAGDRAGEMFATIESLAAPKGGPVDIEAKYLVVTARAC